jgi:very-short-patch-repair endonuclease
MFVCYKCKREFSNKGGFVIHNEKCPLSEEVIKNIIDDYTIHHCSIKDIEKKYSMRKAYFLPFLKLRNRSEALSFGHINKPLKHSEETKLKMRNARLKWMLDNPEKTSWRSSNMSYPEKVFMERIMELEMDKKYLIVREKSVFPYFIDFAFENEKIAVEIDGSQHLEKKRMEIDKKKDKLLIDLGWVI